MATERLRTVKSAGGDYSSLSGWEAGEQTNLVTADEWRTAECYNFSDTTGVTFAGWTTDATRYIQVLGATGNRHNGIWSTSGYRLEVTGNPIVVQADFIYFRYIQVSIREDSTTQRIGIHINAVASGAKTYIEQCLIRQHPSSSGTGNIRGIRSNDASNDGTLYCSNTICYDIQQGSGSGWSRSVSSPWYIYNCGAHNCALGFGVGSSGTTAVLRNNWAQNCTDGFSGTTTAGTDKNISDLASDAPGTTVKNSTNISFVDEANDDFHLDSGDTAAKDWGDDLSGDASYPISVDVDGATRSGSWDAGPDEITSGGSASGSGTPSVPAITSSGSGVASHPGSGSPTLSVVTASGSGVSSHPGSGSPSLSAVTASGVGVSSHPGSGTPTLPAITAAGAGANGKSATGAITLTAISAAGVGLAARVGVGSLNVPALTSSGSGSIGHYATGALVVAAIVAAGAGSIGHSGSGALLLAALSLAGTGLNGVENAPITDLNVQSTSVLQMQVQAVKNLSIANNSVAPLTISQTIV